jgi:multiple sugar transport system substrate-binding protein
MIKCKRIVSLGFLSLAILTVAACNGKKEMVRMGSGRVEITFMNWASEAEQASTQATLDQFNKMQDRIKVNLLAVPMSEYMTKLNTMTASNTLPDCGLMQEPVVLDWAASGMLVDVSDMYKEDPNRPLEQLTFRYKGQPVAYSAAIEPFILYYSKDTFDATGIPYPPAKTENAWTWDEFLAVCKKLTKDRSGKHPGEPGFNANDIVNYGIRFHTANNQFWTAMTMSNGGGFISQDGKELLINKPETIEAIQSLADLGLKHHVAPRGGAAATTNLSLNLY